MTRLNLFLLAILMGSGLYLVRTAYDSRRLFTALDRAQADERVLDIEMQRLVAERQAQATPLRVERAARDKLQMRSATPAVTQYVNWNAASAASASEVQR